MKIVKSVLIVIAVIFALLLIIAFFVPREYNVSRSVVISRPQAEVFDFIKHIRNQDKYSVWNMADPAMKQEQVGTDGTVGFINRWSGNDDVGVGEQEITGLTDRRLDVTIRFTKPFESVMKGFTTAETVGAYSTKVTTVTYGESGYPFNLMNFMMDGMIGNDMQKNLDNMKALLEKVAK